MKFKTESYIRWRPWFAWRPVKVSSCLNEEKETRVDKWVFWEVVERMRDHSWKDWIYREIQNEKT